MSYDDRRFEEERRQSKLRDAYWEDVHAGRIPFEEDFGAGDQADDDFERRVAAVAAEQEARAKAARASRIRGIRREPSRENAVWVIQRMTTRQKPTPEEWLLQNEEQVAADAAAAGMTVAEFRDDLERKFIEREAEQKRLQDEEDRQRAEVRARTLRERTEKLEAKRREGLLRELEVYHPTKTAVMLADNALEPSPALEIVRRFMASTGDVSGFLVLCGCAGAGKSAAAMWPYARLVLDAELDEDSFAFVRHGGMLTCAADLPRHFDAWKGEQPLTEIDRSHRLVVVDDLGFERASERVLEALYRLVNGRQCDGLRTIFTTNGTRDDLLRVYGDRIISRIEHRGAIVNVPGGSLRRKPRAA